MIHMKGVYNLDITDKTIQHAENLDLFKDLEWGSKKLGSIVLYFFQSPAQLRYHTGVIFQSILT